MKFTGQRFSVLPGVHAVCRLEPHSPVPAWAAGSFVSITRTADELSIICPAGGVPAGINADRAWRVLKILGPFSFATTGVLASLTAPLATAGISVLSIATFDTDYLLVKSKTLDDAITALVMAGHERID